MQRFLITGARLFPLCHQRVDLHPGHHLPCRDEIPLAHHDLAHSAGVFAGHIDLGRFDPPVATDETLARPTLRITFPAIPEQGCRSDQQNKETDVFL